MKIRKVEAVEVIRVLVVEGNGTEEFPVKLVEQYWGKNGRYIGKMDHSQLREADVASPGKKRIEYTDEQNEENKKQKIYYLCNGEKADCRKHSCYKGGGMCEFTSDIRYARNFIRNDSENSIMYRETKENGNPEPTEDKDPDIVIELTHMDSSTISHMGKIINKLKKQTKGCHNVKIIFTDRPAFVPTDGVIKCETVVDGELSEADISKIMNKIYVEYEERKKKQVDISRMNDPSLHGCSACSTAQPSEDFKGV